nr:hypothetical protein [Tanacetum cinerariifolium]
MRASINCDKQVYTTKPSVPDITLDTASHQGEARRVSTRFGERHHFVAKPSPPDQLRYLVLKAGPKLMPVGFKLGSQSPSSQY